MAACVQVRRQSTLCVLSCLVQLASTTTTKPTRQIATSPARASPEGDAPARKGRRPTVNTSSSKIHNINSSVVPDTAHNSRGTAPHYINIQMTAIYSTRQIAT